MSISKKVGLLDVAAAVFKAALFITPLKYSSNSNTHIFSALPIEEAFSTIFHQKILTHRVTLLSASYRTPTNDIAYCNRAYTSLIAITQTLSLNKFNEIV